MFLCFEHGFDIEGDLIYNQQPTFAPLNDSAILVVLFYRDFSGNHTPNNKNQNMYPINPYSDNIK
jgi:hypothetical protein